MKERTICISTPESRTYYKALPLAKEFLDREHNIVNTAGTLPEGEVEEFIVNSKTTKTLLDGKLEGVLEVINLEDNTISFREVYKGGILTDVSNQTNAGQTLATQPEKKLAIPVFEGTLVKNTKNVNSFYVNGQEVAEETLGANGTTLELLGQIPDGTAKEFDDNNQLRGEAVYLNNKLNGLVKRYDEEGTLLSEENFIHGQLQGQAIYYTRLKNSLIKTTAFYKNGLLEGERSNYSAQGTLFLSEMYKNGKPNGKRTVMYANGNIESESYFADGRLHGQRKIYFPDGALWYLESYKNGRLDGERTSYFTNSNKRSEEFYSDGILEGLRKIYAENGELLTTEEYHWGTLLHNTERKPL